jgi:hypothetical protein
MARLTNNQRQDSVITFKTETHCKAFFCGQRKEGGA